MTVFLVYVVTVSLAFLRCTLPYHFPIYIIVLSVVHACMVHDACNL